MKRELILEGMRQSQIIAEQLLAPSSKPWMGVIKVTELTPG